ncbi:phospholipase D family protein [Robbsia andropogonis]|uniref:phospholipase D family nuclease n=1 Tax=Robbsia andropogonis TaxID=28092 RepID=UPI0020A0B8B4|nr:phospholipase D family protein [Robbsia andropogonis]MCP1121450.1 phospholipase D family protein [Robbsia andropogonis]MCP1131250.1 phospholipase D family protein [Robbsia andropogonis]
MLKQQPKHERVSRARNALRWSAVTGASVALLAMMVIKWPTLSQRAARWTSTASSVCELKSGFSPEGSAAVLVDDVIDQANSRVQVAAYTFTSPDVVRRLIAAKERGVDVAVIADATENEPSARMGPRALAQLVEAGIAVRTISSYALHHDKYIIADGETVQTGSFNYSLSAARRNSENVIVIASCPAIGRSYETHWQSRWEQGVPYKPVR